MPSPSKHSLHQPPNILKRFHPDFTNQRKSHVNLLTLVTQVFGYTIQEFDDKSGYFILVNTIPRPDGFLEDMTDERMLLFVILGAIYLSGGSIGEGNTENEIITLKAVPRACQACDDRLRPSENLLKTTTKNFPYLLCLSLMPEPAPVTLQKANLET